MEKDATGGEDARGLPQVRDEPGPEEELHEERREETRGAVVVGEDEVLTYRSCLRPKNTRRQRRTRILYS